MSDAITISRFGQPFRYKSSFSHSDDRRTERLIPALQYSDLWNWGFIWSGGWPLPQS